MFACARRCRWCVCGAAAGGGIALRGFLAASAQESLDGYYIYNWSIWMDAFLLAKTGIAVVTGHGAR